MRFGLAWRILILATAAPAVVVVAAFWVVNRSVSTHVRKAADENLRSAARVSQNVLEVRSHHLLASAQVIAQDPRFFAALTVSPSQEGAHFRETMRGVAADFNEIAKADLFEVLDRKGRLIASTGRDATTPDARQALLARTGIQRPASSILVVEDSMYQVAATPVLGGGKVVGSLILGSRIGDELASKLKGLTRSEVTFLHAGGLAGSSLASESDSGSLFTFWQPHASSDELFTAGVTEVYWQTDGYLTLAKPIRSSTPDNSAGYVVQRSLDQETAFLSTLRFQLVQLGSIIVLAAIGLGLFVAREITRPVLQLVRGTEEMVRGNYDYPLDVRTRDEIGYLADRFREMREHQRAFNSLEGAARLKGALLSVASHELRTPISIIKAYNELLADGRLGRTSSEQRRALEVIEQQTAGMERVIQDAIWISQGEDQRPALEQGDHEVKAVVEEAVEEASAEATSRSHDLTVDIEADIGVGRMDGPRVVQAVGNLVRNAIRFTPDGGKVAVHARREDSELVIEVEDSGIGVPKDKEQHLFDRPFLLRDSLQHHSSRTLEFNSAGIGLGLPLVRSIVEAHGGTVEVRSQEGEGSTFTIRLPLRGHEEHLVRQAA